MHVNWTIKTNFNKYMFLKLERRECGGIWWSHYFNRKQVQRETGEATHRKDGILQRWYPKLFPLFFVSYFLFYICLDTLLVCWWFRNSLALCWREFQPSVADVKAKQTSVFQRKLSKETPLPPLPLRPLLLLWYKCDVDLAHVVMPTSTYPGFPPLYAGVTKPVRCIVYKTSRPGEAMLTNICQSPLRT